MESDRAVPPLKQERIYGRSRSRALPFQVKTIPGIRFHFPLSSSEAGNLRQPSGVLEPHPRPFIQWPRFGAHSHPMPVA